MHFFDLPLLNALETLTIKVPANEGSAGIINLVSDHVPMIKYLHSQGFHLRTEDLTSISKMTTLEHLKLYDVPNFSINLPKEHGSLTVQIQSNIINGISKLQGKTSTERSHRHVIMIFFSKAGQFKDTTLQITTLEKNSKLVIEQSVFEEPLKQGLQLIVNGFGYVHLIPTSFW